MKTEKDAQTETLVSDTCFHCGDHTDTPEICFLEDKTFCCEGCKTVFQILSNENLEDYYQLNQKAGIKPKTDSSFEFLKSPEIEEKLLWFNNGKIKKLNFFIPAIHCASCIWLLENLPRIYPEVIESRINFSEKRASITLPSESSLYQLVIFLNSLGYSPNLSFDETKKSNRVSKYNRKLILQMGVAGFSFGNIMLLSFPEYIPGHKGLTSEYKEFFGYLNFALSLPVLLFSAQPYLKSAYQTLKHKSLNMDVPISLGIMAIFIRSSFEIFTQIGPGFMDSLAALVFFLLIGKWFQDKTYRGLSFERDYQSYFPIAVTKIEKDNNSITPIEKLEKNDIIEVRNAELVPTDAILESENAQFDYSFITGESEAISITKNEKVFAGAKVVGKSVVLKVLNKTDQSRLTQLWNQQESENGKLSHLADKVGRNFTWVVLSISSLTAIYWYFVNPENIWLTVSAVLIIACPCALALSIPFAYGNAMRHLGRKGLYLKNTGVIEKLASTKSIVFDKTGTLTGAENATISITENITTAQKELICAVLSQSVHPLSRSILLWLNPKKQLLPSPTKFTEIQGKGLEAIVNNERIKIGSASFLNANSQEIPLTSQVFVSINNTLITSFLVQKNYRKNLENTIQKLKINYPLFMLSGDNDAERKNLEKAFGSTDNLHFKQSPEQKQAFIKRLNQENQLPCMVGDGLNDAAALKESNLGLAIAEDLFQFSPASHGILSAKSFGLLPGFFEFSKKTITIVKVSFAISFMYNIVGVSFAVQGLLTPVVAAILMPISSITVVGFVSIATAFYARKKLRL